MKPNKIFIFFTLLLCFFSYSQKLLAGAEEESLLMLAGWHGEGIPVINWIARDGEMSVYPEPSADLTAEKIPVKHNDEIKWQKSVIVVKTPGKLQIIDPCTVNVFVYDSLETVEGHMEDLVFPAEAILDIISYRAEGFYLFFYQDKYLEHDYFNGSEKFLSEPVTEWWIQLDDKEKPGWVKVDGENISDGERRF